MDIQELGWFSQVLVGRLLLPSLIFLVLGLQMNPNLGRGTLQFVFHQGTHAGLSESTSEPLPHVWHM